MTFVTKKALDRRTFMQGVGATLALPLLEAMVPALWATPLTSTPRLGFIYIANGVIQEEWVPASTGRNFELSPILKPLEPVKSHVNVLSGLSHLAADTRGDGTGDHPRSSAVWLTGVHAYDRSRPDIEVRLATSADQIAGVQSSGCRIGQGRVQVAGLFECRGYIHDVCRLKAAVIQGIVLSHKVPDAFAVIFEAVKLRKYEQPFHNHSLQSCLGEAEIVDARETGAGARRG